MMRYRTWAERHTIIAGVLTVAGMVALVGVGLAALGLFLEVCRAIVDTFWLTVKPD